MPDWVGEGAVPAVVVTGLVVVVVFEALVFVVVFSPVERERLCYNSVEREDAR